MHHENVHFPTAKTSIPHKLFVEGLDKVNTKVGSVLSRDGISAIWLACIGFTLNIT